MSTTQSITVGHQQSKAIILPLLHMRISQKSQAGIFASPRCYSLVPADRARLQMVAQTTFAQPSKIVIASTIKGDCFDTTRTYHPCDHDLRVHYLFC